MNNNIKTGDVLFVWGSGWISESIEDVTGGNSPSHVAMFINPDTVVEAEGNRKFGEQSVWYYINGDCKRCEVWTDESLTDEERNKMVEFSKSLYGQGYDFVLISLELLHYKLGMPIDWYENNNANICSTAVYKIAESIGKKWSNTDEPAPADLMKGGYLKLKQILKQEC